MKKMLKTTLGATFTLMLLLAAGWMNGAQAQSTAGSGTTVTPANSGAQSAEASRPTVTYKIAMHGLDSKKAAILAEMKDPAFKSISCDVNQLVVTAVVYYPEVFTYDKVKEVMMNYIEYKTK